MGQATSRGAAEPDERLRRRLRPRSWAPPPRRPGHDDDHDSHNAHAHTNTNTNTHTLRDRRPALTTSPTPPSSRRLSQRLNPFRRLSSYHTRPDAGSSAPARSHPLPQARPRPRSRLSLGSVTGLLRPSITSHNTEPAYSLAATPLSPAPPRSAHSHAHSERGPYLPHVHIPNLDVDFDRLLDTANPDRPDAHRTRSLASSSALRRDGRALSVLPRLRNTISSSRRRRSIWNDDDNIDNIERLRRGEDQADVLSRLLSLAAAATAASLVGEDHQAATRDGTFDTFLQSLQNGSIASALRGNEGGEGTEAAGGTPAPLNFFRMFRFGTSVDASAGSSARGQGYASGDPGQDSEEDSEGRMVPIIIVGIRSINPTSGPGQDDGNIPPFLDALSSFPTPPTSPGDNENVDVPPWAASISRQTMTAKDTIVLKHKSDLDPGHHLTTLPQAPNLHPPPLPPAQGSLLTPLARQLQLRRSLLRHRQRNLLFHPGAEALSAGVQARPLSLPKKSRRRIIEAPDSAV